MRPSPDGLVIRSLRSVGLTRSQLAGIAAASAVATALIIASAMGRTGAQSAVLAALQRRIVVHATRSGAVASALSAGDAGGAATDAGTSPTQNASSTPAPDSSASSAASSSSAGGTGPDSTAATGSSAPTSTGATTAPAPATPAAPTPSKTKHVFVIAVSTTDFQAAFGRDSVATYLDRTLRPLGTLLSGYHTLGDAQLPDYIAMTSGQAPNADTEHGCATYSEFAPTAKPAADGQVPGTGCVYPNTMLTIGDQVTSSALRWKAYIEDMGSAPCRHPNSNTLDPTQLAAAADQYATAHNPFVYYHSLLDLGDCMTDDVALDQLPADLKSASETPSYSFLAPGRCEDVTALTCPGGQPGGLRATDAFLAQWVPLILHSAAYRHDGALIIAFTAAGPSPAHSSPVRTGALVISRFAKAGAIIRTAYDPYSVLRSAEDLLGFTPLAHATHASSFVTSALRAAVR
jgi:phosphatidylinositol-3-phosphatase